MKYPLSPDTYSFNASAKTITFSGTVPESISNILHVTNVTRGVLYFQPQAGLEYSGSYVSPVLTLLADTSGHSNTDKLLIIYDDGLAGATAENQETANSSLSSIDGKLPALSSGRVPVDVGTSISIGEVEVNNDSGNPIPVSGTVTATGPLTDSELRASAVPVAPAVEQGSGVTTSTTQRVTLASDDSAVESLSSIDSKTLSPVDGRLPVDGSGVTQPVSASSLPLPSGASTSANQETANTSLSSIDGKLPALSGGRVPVDVGTSIDIGEVEIKNDAGNPVPVSAASLPLPSGAATEAKQDTGNTSLSNIDSNVGSKSDAAASTDTGTFSLIAFIKRGLQNWATLLERIPVLVSGRIPVDGSGVTQPVSGTVTATGPLTDAELRATAVPISASSLPLPTGAATSANQTTANTSLASIAGLTIPAHDYISLSYTGTNLTGVVYKTGGSGGTTVATLTLAYSGSSLISVTKS
jgi:hypothetical protein